MSHHLFAIRGVDWNVVPQPHFPFSKLFLAIAGYPHRTIPIAYVDWNYIVQVLIVNEKICFQSNTAFAPSDATGAKQLQEPAPRLRGLFTRVLTRTRRRRRRHPSQRRSSKRLILRGQKDAASGLNPTSEAAAEHHCPASDLYYHYVFYEYRLIVMYNCEVVYDLDRYVPE